MKISKQEALDKVRAAPAFVNVSDGNIWNTPVGIKGVLNVLEALGLIEFVEPVETKSTSPNSSGTDEFKDVYS